MAAQRKTVGRALGQGIEEQGRINTSTLTDQLCLGQRQHGLKKHQVVQDLDHLTATDAAAQGDFGGKGRNQRAQSLKEFGLGTDHYRQRARLRGRPGPGKRRIGKGHALLRKGLGQRTRGFDRRGAEVDQDLPIAHRDEQPSGLMRNLMNDLARRQTEKNNVDRRDEFGHRRRTLRALGGKSVQRLGLHVKGGDRHAGLSNEVAADGFTHDTETNESDTTETGHDTS